jgi:hypothetical protein
LLPTRFARREHGQDVFSRSKGGKTTMYKIFIFRDKKKIFVTQTASYSYMQGVLFTLRRRGYVCEVEYPEHHRRRP